MKYYKILRSDMTHHGFVYKEGLNVDINPFDETPCCGGGLFFSDAENILSFVGYGDLIAEVKIPNGEQIVQVRSKYKSHTIVLKNIKPLWNIDTLEYLIQAGIDIHVNNDYVFGCAAESGYLDIVKYLISQGANIHADNNWAFRRAASNGHLKIVQYLKEQDEFMDDYAFLAASENGQLDVVKYFVENGVDIHSHHDYAFRWAAHNNHLEVVKYLADNGADIKYGTPEILEYLNSINK